MPTNILMPALSPTMTEGNIAAWLKKEGDIVVSGDLLCEIETDKATMEIEAIEDGILASIVTPDGTENVPVNTVIGIIIEEGEELSSLSEKKVEKETTIDSTQIQGGQEPIQVTTEDQTVNSSEKNNNPNQRIFASPLARRMAEQSKLSLSAIAGTGPSGRIVKADIERELLATQSLQPTAQQTSAITKDITTLDAHVGAGEAMKFNDVQPTKMRKIIAERLQFSKQNIPHFYLSVDCEVDELLKTRKELNEKAGDYKLSLNDFIIRAAAIALREVPECNAAWHESVVRQYDSSDISVAVAIDDGLVTPIIRNAENKGLRTISNEMRDLADRARVKPMKLTPDEYQGGTFSISNLGMYGIKNFSAIINPPQSMILAVGAGEQRPIVKEGALAIATVMSCTLAVDHRVVDGAAGAKFFKVFKGLIENPLTLLL